MAVEFYSFSHHNEEVIQRRLSVLVILGLALAAVGLGVAPPATASTPSAYAWGDNNMGQLGDGSRSDRNTPTPISVPPGITFTSISAGAEHTCALDTAGAAYCWGENRFGQLGNGQSGTGLFETVPTAVLGGRTFSSLATGGYFTCAMDSGGTAFCWGNNLYGQLGDGSTTASNVPVPVIMPSGVTFTAISGGLRQACGLTASGAAYCWGNNLYGQLGDGSTTAKNVPTPVIMPSGVTFTSISAGGLHTCALANSSAAYCWGDNLYGQLGDGSTTSKNVPTPVIMPSGVTFTSIAIGGYFSCALTAAGLGYCWGNNFYGQLGDGTTIDRLTPTLVIQPSGIRFSTIAVGWDHSCALSTNAVAYCVGRGGDGQLGDGSSVNSSSGLLVSGGFSFASIWSGSSSFSSYALLPTRASGDNIPQAPLQQFGRSVKDTCETQPSDLIDFPALTDLKNQRWGASWAQWPNGGTGGFVCSRQPYYTNTGRWAVE